MATHAFTTPAPSALRLRMESAIDSMMAACDRLVAELDAMDADPDLEDGGDKEHTLGRSEALDQTKPNYPADDLEPSLGAPNPNRWVSQLQWGAREHSAFPMQDFEEQCEDEGAPDDREPNPGEVCNWQDEGDQTTLRVLPC